MTAELPIAVRMHLQTRHNIFAVSTAVSTDRAVVCIDGQTDGTTRHGTGTTRHDTVRARPV